MAASSLLFTFASLLPSTLVRLSVFSYPFFYFGFLPIGDAMASILNLHVTLVFMLRYFFVASPFAYRHYVTKKTISIALATIWIVVLAFVYVIQMIASGYLTCYYNATITSRQSKTTSKERVEKMPLPYAYLTPDVGKKFRQWFQNLSNNIPKGIKVISFF
ncbi:hypothetical protein TrispH2_004624 [Trichoplax sp. H2]|nr:hypothetical protein TrispH2_004624 [Trichoplax sp. H2]|eukprot:RDD44201.1 hypothetical protein TrispH2_004624 [Trichoplax sp. H2]